jgi:tetratricopeptide (TPR) repeat protein
MRRFSLAVVAVLTLVFFRILPAQDESGERVQQLHAEAQQAEAGGDVAGAIRKYEEILRLSPKLSAAYNNLGALYFRLGEYSKAANVLQQGLKLNPSMTTASALLGISRYKMNEYAEARKPLEAALKANPQDNNAALFLANDLTKLGDFAGAASTLQQLARRQPKNQQVWYMLAQVYMRLSEQSLAKMNAIDPNSALSHALSAEVMESMNNYEGAVAELKKAVDLAPHEAGMHYKLGDAYWNLEQWDQATREFDAELANDPQNCQAQWKLGNITLQQNGSPEEALSHEEKALGNCPTLTGAQVDRGRALLKLHRNDEALREFEKAEKLEPTDPQIHYLLAQAFRALGRAQEAKAEMQMFSKLGQQQRAATAQQAQDVVNAKGTPR